MKLGASSYIEEEEKKACKNVQRAKPAHRKHLSNIDSFVKISNPFSLDLNKLKDERQ